MKEKTSATDKKLYKLSYAPIIISLVFLFNPNFNIIDILPDFVAFFLLASQIGAKGELIPYLSEAKNGLKKLGVLTLIKIPAMLVMYANTSSGMDIIPLFTLVFSSLEVILLISTVDNLFDGLYYLGERSEADALITPFRFLGVSVKAESVKALSYLALCAKVILAFIPEMCLLTVESARTQARMAALYLPLLLGSLLISLILGALWLTLTVTYVNKVKNSCRSKDILRNVAGESFAEELDAKTKFKSMLGAVSLLGFSSLFLFDLRFAETGEVNILPHFLYGLVILSVAIKILSNRIHRLATVAAASLYSLFSILFGIFNIRFLDSFSYRELSEDFFNPEALEAYRTVELFATLEALFFVLMASAMSVGFISFVRNNTALSPTDPLYSRQDRDRHRSLSVRAAVSFALAAVIAILKCLNVYLKAEVKLIFGRTDVILSNSAPWLETVIFIAVLLLVIFQRGVMEDVKEDVKLKHRK